MEPLFFKAENHTVSATHRGLRDGFNGAAFFQSGKCQSAACGWARYVTSLQ